MEPGALALRCLMQEWRLPVALKDNEVMGPCPDLARLTRQITGDVPSRVAARRSGVSHDTITRMWQGDRVSEAIVIRFALGYGVDPDPLLKAIGRPSMAIQRKAFEAALQAESYPLSPEMLSSSDRSRPVDRERIETSSDPLRLIGSELDPQPFIAALRDVRGIGANVEKLKDPDAPGEDVLIGPVRAFRVEGDCMKPYLEEGDEILVLPAKYARDGELVTATVNLGAITCKQIRIEEGRSWLEPVNGEGRIEEGDFTVTGVVFRVISDPIKLVERRREREKK